MVNDNHERLLKPRPSLEQVAAIVDFMTQHPVLGHGHLRGLEGRNESKRLWLKLAKTLNSLKGPTRPLKSWVKYWADKKSTVRSKVTSSGGDPSVLGPTIERKIWDIFLSGDAGKHRNSVKVESQFSDENNFDDENTEDNHNFEEACVEVPAFNFEEPTMEPLDIDERNTLLMEKMVKVMSDQATAMTELAQASQVSAQAMERLAEASHIQARAIERLASTFETISSNAQHISTSIVEIDATMKRFYNTTPT